MDKAPDAFRIISEVADDLDVPQHVLRFWETRFSQIRPMKRSGGRRYYRPDDVDLLRGIRHLLYGEGYTIRGVQRILREHGAKAVLDVARGQKLPPREAGASVQNADFDAGADLEGDEDSFPEDDAVEADSGLSARGGSRPEGSGSGNRREPAMTTPNQSSSVRLAQGMREPTFDAPSVPGQGMASESVGFQGIGGAGAQGFGSQGLGSQNPRQPHAAPIGGGTRSLRIDDARKLESVLHELQECRRLMDAALERAR